MSKVMGIFKDLDTSCCVEMFQYIFPIDTETFLPTFNMTVLGIIIKNKTKQKKGQIYKQKNLSIILMYTSLTVSNAELTYFQILIWSRYCQEKSPLRHAALLNKPGWGLPWWRSG